MDYICPTKDAKCEICEKKSRFIAHITYVETEEEAQSFITKIKKEHYDARHNVYAYILKSGEKKYSDDGEPSKTGGFPVLEMLENEKITNICCVVTRYFGGTLLGVGGLIRAYTKAAKDCLLLCEVKEKKLCDLFEISFDYAFLNKTEHILKTNNFLIESKNFAENVILNVVSEKDKSDLLKEKLESELGINFKIKKLKEIYK